MFRKAVANKRIRKLYKTTLADELLQNQNVTMDIIIHEEVKEKIPSGYYKRQKVSPRKVSEKDCAARETEGEKLKQISDATKDNLNINSFLIG